MKTLRIISIIVILLSIASCTMNRPLTKEVMVLDDVTDQKRAQPMQAEILSLFSFDGMQKWNGNIFRYAEVSDISLNATKIISLPKEINWFSNELEREQAVRDFQKQVSDALKKDAPDSSGKSYSSVYLSLAHALTELAGSKSDSKVLLLYSDLMENSFELSFYQDPKLLLLKNNPDSIKRKLEELAPLPLLQGIEVHLIYQPVSITADWKYRIVSGFYKKVLESKGAKVFIEANLQKHDAE
jgi:hypothetical protein